MQKPPRGIGIPKCTCIADETNKIIEHDEINCNYHVHSSQVARDWIETNLWNPNG